MSKKIGLHDRVTKTDNFIESTVDDEVILMHLDEGNFSSLKSTGLRIWTMLNEPTSAAQICERMCDEFDVDEELCREQALEFLNSLNDRQFVSVID